MTNTSFGNIANAYWQSGYSVLPLEKGEKRPAQEIKSWTGYCNNLPKEKIREQWLERYADYGIGLALGMEISGGFRIGAVDVDRDDLVRVVAALLDHPVSRKRGAKGETFFVKVPAGEKMKSTSIKTHEKEQVVDLLLSGKMTVLPPSLHPKGMAYTWTGKELLECDLDELPVFDKNKAKLLSLIISSEHAPALMSGKGTHDAGLRLAAKLVSARFKDDEIERAIKALLPEDYQGNSLDELSTWIADARKKGFDEGGEGSEGRANLLQMLLELSSEAELFHDGDRAFASVPVDGGQLTYAIDSELFKRWLRRQAHLKLGKPISRTSLNDAIAAIETEALFTGERRTVEIRISGNEEVVEIDLGQPDGCVVRIDSDGWKVDKGQHRFYRSPGFGGLPKPEQGGDLRDLQALLELDDEAFQLFLAFLHNALKPTGPYFGLLVEGEQGSGKSFLCSVAKMLIDPNKASRLHLPENTRDLMIQAKEFRLLSYDNASFMKAEISDALCALATGGGIAVRRLYTNDDLQVLTYMRPFIINGISGYAKRPDLLERAIPLRLRSMPESQRRTEADMMKQFQAMKPRLLGSLYNAVAVALKNLNSVVAPKQFRMADAARWVAASDTALDFHAEEILQTILRVQTDLSAERVNQEPIVIRLREVVKNGFDGYMGDLYTALGCASDRTLPKSPSALSTALERLRPSMEKVGIIVEYSRDKGGRKVTITIADHSPSRNKKF